MGNSWLEIIRTNFNLKVVLIGFVFGLLLESILVIVYPAFIGVLGAVIIFYCGLMAGLMGGGKIEDGIVNGALCGFGVPVVVLISYLFQIPSYLPFIGLIEYIISIIFIGICVGVVGAFGGFIGSIVKRIYLSLNFEKPFFTYDNTKKNLDLKAVLIGLIFGLILSQIHFIPAIPIILGSGLITGYIASGKNNNGIINGFVCCFGIELVLIILAIIIYLIRAITNTSLHISLYSILGAILLYIIYLTTFGLIYGLIGGIGGYVGSEIKGSNNGKKGRSIENQGYLVCKKCGGYYKLQSGESLEDFEKCQCGGKLDYFEHIDETKIENIDKKLTYDEEIKNLTKDDSEGKEEETDIPTMLGVLNRMVFRIFEGYLIFMALAFIVIFTIAYLQMHSII